MNRIFIAAGKLVGSLTGSTEGLNMNTPADAIYIDMPELLDINTHFYCENTGQVLKIPEPPDKYHKFDYLSGLWVPTTDLTEARNDALNLMKVKFNAKEFGGFVYNGVKFDSDLLAQQRIASLVVSTSIMFTASNNQTIELTSAEFTELKGALSDHIQQVHAEYSEVKNKLLNANTLPEILRIIS